MSFPRKVRFSRALTLALVIGLFSAVPAANAVGYNIAQPTNYITASATTDYTYGAALPASMPTPCSASVLTNTFLFSGQAQSYETGCAANPAKGILHHWQTYLYFPDPNQTPVQLQVCEVSNTPTYVAINNGLLGGGSVINDWSSHAAKVSTANLIAATSHKAVGTGNTSATWNGQSVINPIAQSVATSATTYNNGYSIDVWSWASSSSSFVAVYFDNNTCNQNSTDNLPYVTPNAFTNIAPSTYGTFGSTVTIAPVLGKNPPSLATTAASSITTTSATIGGTITPNNDAITAASYVYGTSSDLSTGTTTSSISSSVWSSWSDATAHSTSLPLTGLTPSTTYYYKLNATNSTGSSSSAIGSFVTATPTYTVHFDNQGHGSSVSDATNVTTILHANLPTDSDANYTLLGWSLTSGGAVISGNYAPAADGTTLYAIWLHNTYTTSFNANGGSGSLADQSSNVAAALAKNTLTKSHYNFTGWNTAADGSGTSYADQATYPFTASTTLYAQWTLAPLTDQTLIVASSSTSLNYYQTATLSTSGSLGTGAITYSVQSGNCSLNASVLTATGSLGTCLVTASIAADADYNSATSAPISITLGKAVLSVTPDAQSLRMGSASPTYTFVLTGFVNSENVSNADGYTAPTCTSSYTKSTSAADSPLAISCSGGSATNYDFSYLPSNLTITPIPTHSVSFSLDGGSGTTPTQSATTEGSSFTIPDGSGFSKAGYDFAGWSDGTSTYLPGDSYTVSTSDISLTALWTVVTPPVVTPPVVAPPVVTPPVVTPPVVTPPVVTPPAPATYTLTYDVSANGTLAGSLSQSVTSGDSGSAVTAVADAGYHFVSWSDLSTDNPRTDNNVTADLNVSAIFAADPVVTPPVVTPPVVIPPVVTPPVVTPPVVTPPVVTPPVVTPPVVTPPVVVPPVVTPPVVTPPVVTPPVVVPPVVVPPVVTPPVVAPPAVTPPLVVEPIATPPVVTPPVVTPDPVYTDSIPEKVAPGVLVPHASALKMLPNQVVALSQSIAINASVGTKVKYLVINNKQYVLDTPDLKNIRMPILVGPKDKVVVALVDSKGNQINVPVVQQKSYVDLANVNFAVGKYALNTDAKKALDLVASRVIAHGFTVIDLTGYTDAQGVNSGYNNQKLSQQRGQAAAAYLKSKLGNAEVTIKIEAKSHLNPIASNATAAGQAMNRRVEIAAH